jgi:hypothetical protein
MTRWGWIAAIGAAILSAAVGAIAGYEIATFRSWDHTQRLPSSVRLSREQYDAIPPPP